VTPNVSAYDRFRALGAVLDVARFPLPTSALHEVPVRDTTCAIVGGIVAGRAEIPSGWLEARERLPD
jgi:hypothetical protein